MEKTKEEILEEGRKLLELNKSGYAGILSTGQIVDRREHPEAIPVPESSMFGVAKPKENKQQPYHHIHCRSCGAEIIFVLTLKGHRMPIEYKAEFINDKEFDSKKHISHFANCPEANKFRKKRK